MRHLQLLLAVATVAAAATSAPADAKPRRVVVVDFDGLPRSLADNGRASVMTLLGDQYDLVNARKWETARAEVSGRGQLQWQQAAKKSGVDAIVEGWINTEGRHHTLTVQVRDANTGIEIDSVSVTMGDKGMSTAATKSLRKQLDDILTWIEGDATSWDVHATLPAVGRPAVGSHDFRGHEVDDRDDDDEEDDEGPDVARRASRRHGRGHRRRDRDRDSDRDPDRQGAPDRGRDREPDRDGDRDSSRPTRTAQLEPTPPAKPYLPEKSEKPDKPEKSDKPEDVLTLFAPDSREAEVVAAVSAPKIMKPAPRFFVEGGAFITSRGMTFTHDPPDSKKGTPDYPAQGLQGISLGAAVYPLPTDKLSNDPSGIGFSFHLQKSIGALFSAYDPAANTYGDYTIDHTAYEGAIHYRLPTEYVVGDLDLGYGSFAYAIANDPSGGIQIPDVNYTYVSLGGTLDLKVTDRARAGFGGHYMYLLDAGDVSTEMSYGAGSASGLDLEAHFQIPIGDALFVRGVFDYRRVALELEGSGNVASTLEIGSVTDSSIGGQLELGVQF